MAASAVPPPAATVPPPVATIPPPSPVIDRNVNQASASRVKIPPPVPKQFLLPDPANALSAPQAAPDAPAAIELAAPLAH